MTIRTNYVWFYWIFLSSLHGENLVSGILRSVYDEMVFNLSKISGFLSFQRVIIRLYPLASGQCLWCIMWSFLNWSEQFISSIASLACSAVGDYSVISGNIVIPFTSFTPLQLYACIWTELLIGICPVFFKSEGYECVFNFVDIFLNVSHHWLHFLFVSYFWSTWSLPILFHFKLSCDQFRILVIHVSTVSFWSIFHFISDRLLFQLMTVG